jgi:cellulose synthase/poly-beta-1,6-N-acetylglucosamine synthase-like glycosyltransferase
MNDQDERPAATVRTMEIVVAVALFVLGAVVIYDSLRLGAKWGSDGPEAGYFPFYIGLLICVSTAVVFFRALGAKARRSFVSRDALALVMKMLVPSIVYVVLISFLGIYVASTVYIVFFMVWLGKYSWLKSIAVGFGVSLVFFLLFEVWFKVPLPKGPLEGALGLL